jgi:hypothetical protein
VRRLLEDARLAGRRRRLAIAGPTFVLGNAAFAAGLVLLLLHHNIWWWTFFLPGISCGMLALMPTDRLLSTAYTTIGGGVLLAVGAMGVQHLLVEHACISAGVDDARPPPPCATATLGDEASASALELRLALAFEATYATIHVVPAVVLWASLVPPRLPSRLQLERLWAVLSWHCIASALAYAALWLPAAAMRQARGAERSEVLVSTVLEQGYKLFIAYVGLRPRMRTRWQARLAARGEAISSAAGIAALMGGQSANALLAQAAAHFRYVRFGALDASMLASSSAAPAAYAVSAPADFAQVDAFLSHSWNDDASAKWAALGAWCAEFEIEHGREPLVWLDRCCIDQTDIESALPSLPVYLAGCQSLLVLFGPTFLTRLWCVVELFTFLSMGGTNVELRPFGWARARKSGSREGKAERASRDSVISIWMKRASSRSDKTGDHKSKGATSTAGEASGPNRTSVSSCRSAEPAGSEASARPSAGEVLAQLPKAALTAEAVAMADEEAEEALVAARMQAAIDAFESRSCQCAVLDDKARMLSFIEAACGTTEAFDVRVRQLLTAAAGQYALVRAEAKRAESRRAHAATPPKRLSVPSTLPLRRMLESGSPPSSVASTLLALRRCGRNTTSM